jgi:hypothetical protein
MLNGLNLYTVNASKDSASFKGNPANTGGANRVVASQNSNGYVVKSALNVGNSSNSSTAQNVVSKNTMSRLLEGFIYDDPKALRIMYEDIYKYDAIAGSAVDIFSSLPFSSFDLIGIEDEEVLEVYQRSCDNLKLKTSLPSISRDFLTFGAFVGTTLFDKNEKVFTNIMPQSLNSAKITEIPIYGVDPIIDLEVPNSLKQMMRDKDPRLQKIFNDLPSQIKNDLNKGKIQLPPETTIYLARKTLTSDFMGTSYLQRMLPIHLYEKTLYRGTLDQANRRMRAILHILAGDDEWIPPQEDLNNVRDLFMQADSDPTGAIIVTRPGIQPNEVRSATDFFRYDEVDPYFAQAKYRALNISESIITGEFSISTLDATLSVLVDSFRAYREMLTRDIFYEKIFPAVALANNFLAKDYQVQSSRRLRSTSALDNYTRHRVTCEDRNRNFTVRGVNYNTGNFAIPSLEWHKHLKPEGDAAYLELLNSLSDKGVPVTLGMYAAAAGLNLDSILRSMEPDLALRKDIASYLKQVNKVNQSIQPQDQDQQNMQSAEMLAALVSNSRKRKLKPVGLGNREFTDADRMHERNKKGEFKSTSKRRMRELEEDANKTVAKALKRLNRRQLKAQSDSTKNRPEKLISSGVYGVISSKKGK